MEVRAVAYANYPNVALHRAVMRALLDNRARGARLRLSLTEIVAAVERLGVPATADQVAGSLRELEELKVVDSMQSFERVRTAAELRLNHFSYDVTGLGERIEQFFDELGGLVEAVGSLDANRLARIRASRFASRLPTASTRPPSSSKNCSIRSPRPVTS